MSVRFLHVVFCLCQCNGFTLCHSLILIELYEYTVAAHFCEYIHASRTRRSQRRHLKPHLDQLLPKQIPKTLGQALLRLQRALGTPPRPPASCVAFDGAAARLQKQRLRAFAGRCDHGFGDGKRRGLQALRQSNSTQATDPQKIQPRGGVGKSVISAISHPNTQGTRMKPRFLGLQTFVIRSNRNYRSSLSH